MHKLGCKKNNIQITEKLGFGMLLASAGGLMDVYSYTVRGQVFATGQTGNFVLVAFQLSKKNYLGMIHPFVPIMSFWAGFFVAWHMFYSLSKENPLLWQRRILATSIFILFFTGFIPCSYPNIIADSLIAFAASFQYCAFRKFGIDENYASIFCSGNMRSCVDNYYKGIVRKDKQALKRALKYSCILISFLAGAAIGALESGIFHEKAIWTAAVLLSTALVLSFVFDSDQFAKME
ncbi:YoaK family protein [Desulfosporosinus acididurans]|nr:YoaK family protein [Desulfosporosinus acididurans]